MPVLYILVYIHTIRTSIFSFIMFTATTVFCINIKDCFKRETSKKN